MKGYYRFIDQPDDSAVTMDNILAPHRQRTVWRMAAQRTVLCIQDGTEINSNGLEEREGLGVIGTNQTGAESLGLHLHSTLAVTDDGLPWGCCGRSAGRRPAGPPWTRGRRRRSRLRNRIPTAGSSV